MPDELQEARGRKAPNHRHNGSAAPTGEKVNAREAKAEAASEANEQDTSKAAWLHAAVEQFEVPLVRYTQRLTGDLETARDIVQETFLRLWREDPAELEGHLAPWLYTVCRRRALDVKKKEARMHVSTQEVAAREASDTGGLPIAEHNEAAEQILKLLGSLPANQQEVVRLKFQAGLSYREISSVTNLSVSNVGYLIHTALQTLRKLVAASSG